MNLRDWFCFFIPCLGKKITNGDGSVGHENSDSLVNFLVYTSVPNICQTKETPANTRVLMENSDNPTIHENIAAGTINQNSGSYKKSKSCLTTTECVSDDSNGFVKLMHSKRNSETVRAQGNISVQKILDKTSEVETFFSLGTDSMLVEEVNVFEYVHLNNIFKNAVGISKYRSILKPYEVHDSDSEQRIYFPSTYETPEHCWDWDQSVKTFRKVNIDWGAGTIFYDTHACDDSQIENFELKLPEVNKFKNLVGEQRNTEHVLCSRLPLKEKMSKLIQLYKNTEQDYSMRAQKIYPELDTIDQIKKTWDAHSDSENIDTSQDSLTQEFCENFTQLSQIFSSNNSSEFKTFSLKQSTADELPPSRLVLSDKCRNGLNRLKDLQSSFDD